MRGRASIEIAAALLLCAGPSLRAQAPPAAEQIAGALLAAPEALQDGATVLGYGGEPRSGDVLTTLREGTGPLLCLADDPAEAGFHVACYHRSLEPFMALGRRLRAAGRTRAEVMDARYAALRAGDLSMPDHPAALFSLTAPSGGYDASSGQVSGGRRLLVVYVAHATAEDLGLPTRPEGDAPWLMLPGTPWAHIMISR